MLKSMVDISRPLGHLYQAGFLSLDSIAAPFSKHYSVTSLKTGEPIVESTRTKLGPHDVVPYNLPPHSAKVFTGQRRANLTAFFENLDRLVKIRLPNLKEGKQDFFLTKGMPKSFWGTIVNELLKAREELGFHQVSGAMYSAFGAFHGQRHSDDNTWHFVSASNIDPPFQHITDLKHRRCAENSLISLATHNNFQKLRYLFLMRGPNPEGYGSAESQNGLFDFAKLVPCTGCLPHLERLYRDGGNLILVTSTEQATKLESKINKAEKTTKVKHHLGDSVREEPKRKFKIDELLKDLRRGDVNIIYPSDKNNLNAYAFIEVPNKNLTRIITERRVGTNVASGGIQNQKNRAVTTFNKWLNQSINKSRRNKQSNHEKDRKKTKPYIPKQYDPKSKRSFRVQQVSMPDNLPII